MLSTHNFRTLSIESSQTPLCQCLEFLYPKELICSATISIEKMLWISSPNQIISSYDRFAATQENEYFKKNTKIDPRIKRETDVIDPFLSFYDLNIGTQTDPVIITTTPAPCMGVINEIITRSRNYPLCHIPTKLIEADPEKYYMYGELISESRGVIKNFEINKEIKATSRHKLLQSEEYLIIDFIIPNIDYSSNYISQGFPWLTHFGMFVSDELESKIKENLQFAIGVKSINKGMAGVFTLTGNRPKEQIEGCIVIKGPDNFSLSKLKKILEEKVEFDFVGTKLFVTSANISNVIHSAYWLLDSTENISNLQKEVGVDSLDIAFLLSSKNVLSLPMAVGFAFLSEPKKMQHIDGRRQHAWSELLFKSLFFTESNFDEKFFFEKTYNQENKYFLWKACS
ncbi:hypothetical protein [Acinetobacter baumannii]|uniref:hypothetical protein n=1 Tax=Acinetobacter baumannii TaxID=470 RepID=UPI00111373E7|nr:hypothetical protein [Acinetobacter baumannii]